MKTNIYVLLALIVFSACGKTTPDALITATINGHATNFNVSAQAVTSAITIYKGKFVSVSGYNSNNDSEEVTIRIADSILTPGKMYFCIPDSTYFNVSVSFKDASGTTYSNYRADVSQPNLPAQAVITSITSNHIKGTFSATLEAKAGGNTNISITNGTFDLPLTYTGDTSLPWK